MKMKEMIKNVKKGFSEWLGTPQAAMAITVGVLMIVAWLAGWLMGHFSGSGVTMVFENAAYGRTGLRRQRCWPWAV